MTKEKILKTEPGPELDRLVAERVMRWTLDEKGWQENFKPSVDIVAAWKVVNRLREKQFDIMIKTLKDRWEVLISDSDKILDWYATAPELPLAICRAALLAVSAET